MLTFLGDGNADTIVPAAQPGEADPPKPLINFYKRALTADIIREIQQYQTQPYNLQPCAPILAFIEKSCEDVDKAPDLYELSLSLEPRERDDEKM
jgi:son of sevenless-like protein